MIAILAVSLVVLAGALTAIDLFGRDTPLEWSQSATTLSRVQRIRTILESIGPERQEELVTTLSQCHEGYTLTPRAFAPTQTTSATQDLQARIAHRLNIEKHRLSVGMATLARGDFAYSRCTPSEISLPMNAVVVSILLDSGRWLNVEVHPHEWHLDSLLERLLQYSAACLFIGALSILLIHRLSKPLNDLTHAARKFGAGLNVQAVPEAGPPDLRRAIESFNAMQRQVADEVSRRAETLAAISHDLRTPLTALRIKAELVDDQERRADLACSIEKLEKIVASALEFLRGESRSEPLRSIDLGAMLSSECSDCEDAGLRAEYTGDFGIHYACRPEALARAVRNLIENADKYAGGAQVGLRCEAGSLEISVSDRGPGIPAHQFARALQPFQRLSKARESHRGGFGLGLAIAQAVARGHDGELILTNNSPSGLVATLRLPPPRI
jgi:signal transduction histidine kinase